MRTSRVIAALSAFGLALLLGACGQAADTTPAGEPAAVLHMSKTKHFNTVAELRAESTVIALGTAGGSRVVYLNDIPMTLTKFRVDRLVSGEGAEELEIAQPGGDGVASPDSSPLLTSGTRYLLFLAPQGVIPGYSIIGGQGVFRATANGVEFAGAPGSTLPQRLALDDVIAQVRP